MLRSCTLLFLLATCFFSCEGPDRERLHAVNQRFFRYASIASGNEVFQVKAARPDGKWTDGTGRAFSTNPPFWQRTWFWVLMTIFALVLCYLLIMGLNRFRWRHQRRLFELQQKVQQERERISRDLHDHVGTQLSLISRNIDDMLAQSDGLSVSAHQLQLAAISQNSKEVIATLRETIWALNKKEISLEEFSDKLKPYVHKQLNVYDDMELHFTEAEGADTLMLHPAAAINLFRICQEAITNAIKYANASRLDIRFSIQAGKFKIEIRDNGKGIDPVPTGPVSTYGLANMKFRAAEIGCDFELQTIPLSFTAITISKK